MLSECKRLRSAQFPTILPKAPHLPLACESMFFRIHFHIILRKAALSMVHEEGTVSAIKNVDFGIIQVRIMLKVHCPILFADESRHYGSPMSRILAMED